MALVWPDDRTFAICVTFDVDGQEVWRGEAGADATTLAQGRYGLDVGMPAILDLLARFEVSATFFAVGRVAEEHPDVVARILESGHEVASHGYSHRSPMRLDVPAREQELLRSKETLETLGATASGYRAPGWEMAASDLPHLEDLGFRYSSNVMDALSPYIHPGTSIVELPVHWVLDDAPHFWFGPADWSKKISDPAEIGRIWEGEMLGIADRGGLCVLTLHPQIIGRPGRLRLLEDLLRLIASFPHAWVARCQEVASYARSHLDTT